MPGRKADSCLMHAQGCTSALDKTWLWACPRLSKVKLYFVRNADCRQRRAKFLICFSTATSSRETPHGHQRDGTANGLAYMLVQAARNTRQSRRSSLFPYCIKAGGATAARRRRCLSWQGAVQASCKHYREIFMHRDVSAERVRARVQTRSRLYQKRR